MNEKISVVVPVYNVEKYLAECIESIMFQSYKNLEIIIVNDGSTDHSLDICKKYKEQDERIILINKKNGGLSSARNLGLKYATGEYVGFVDSDDLIDKDMYQILYDLIQSSDSDIVCCDYIGCDEDSNIETGISDSGEIFQYTNYEAVSYLLYDDYYKCFAWNKLYKKNLFEDINYPEGKWYEDISTTYKLMIKSSKITYVRKRLYVYRERSNSITNAQFDKRTYDLLDAINEVEKDISKLPDLYRNDMRVGCLLYYFFFVNVMINGDYMDQEIYCVYQKMLKQNFRMFFCSGKIGIVRKIQMILCAISVNGYRRIYARVKKQYD